MTGGDEAMDGAGSAVVAADIGGTFTDIAWLDGDGAVRTRKVPSTPEDYAGGVLRGIEELCATTGLELASIELLLHACTVATNAILEHKGARTALLTTRGFRDVLELMRVRVPRLYEPLYVKPPPLVPRRLRLEITERIGPDGEVITPLELADVDAAIELLQRERIEAVAVAFLHAYAESAHEQQVGERLRAALPGVFVSLSSDVLPEMREYERTSTTVVNAYVGPPVRRYLESLVARLVEAGSRARLQVMQSSGGVIDVASAMARPAQIVECGPAAGIIGAAKLGREAGLGRLITLDMGGTTAKAAIVVDGRLAIAQDYEVGGGISLCGPLVMGGGYALKLPVIDVAEVGAGGGSIVALDAAGVVKVGPESAGADPGPVCYRQGGTRPTVTDANVVLGYLDPDALAGGSVPIDGEAARQAIADQLAAPLGRRVEEIAAGIHELANVAMMRAVKSVSTHRGHDPRDFSLFAFGGSGGVHAASLAGLLGIRRIVIPPAAGVFSALGLLLADTEVGRVHAFPRDLAALVPSELSAMVERLAGEVRAEIGAGPVPGLVLERTAQMRFRGQAYEIHVDLPADLDRPDLAALLREAFLAAYERLYGYAGEPGLAVEIVAVRVVGRLPTGRRLRPSAPPVPASPPRARLARFGRDSLETTVIARGHLDGGWQPGPLIVEEYESTVVIPPGARARLDDFGSILIEVPAP
jgi:N-methylhydantoinase A